MPFILIETDDPAAVDIRHEATATVKVTTGTAYQCLLAAAERCSDDDLQDVKLRALRKIQLARRTPESAERVVSETVTVTTGGES